MLEREGVELEVRANRVDPRPDGWRVRLALRRRLPRLRRLVQARARCRTATARLRRRRLVRSLRRPRRRPRVRARRARGATSTSRERLRAFTTSAFETLLDLAASMSLLRFPEPYDFELSTGRFRAFGTDLANLGRGRRCTARRRARGADHGARRAASTSSRSTTRRGPSSSKLLGAPFDLEPFYALGRDDPVLAPARRRGCAASARRSQPTRSRRSSPRSPRSRSRSSPRSRSATA